MWLQQRLKGLPGLLSSSWARRLLCLLGLLLLLLWLGGSGARRAAGGLHLLPWARGPPGAAEPAACLGAATRAWRGLRERGEAVPPGPGVPALVANGYLALDVAANRLWVTPGEREPPVAPDFAPFVQLRPLGARAEAAEAVLLLREGLLRRVRCLQLGASAPGPAAGGSGPASAAGLGLGLGLGPGPGAARDCVLLQEDFLAHRGRPHVYLQRLQLRNPTERVAALQTLGPTAGPPPRAFTSTLEKAGDHQFLLYSGRAAPLPSGLVHLVVVAAKKLVDRLQVAPKSQLDETVLWVVHVSGPLSPQALKSRAAKELKALQDLARKEMLELLELPAAELLQDHQRLWAQLFSPGPLLQRPRHHARRQPVAQPAGRRAAHPAALRPVAADAAEAGLQGAGEGGRPGHPAGHGAQLRGAAVHREPPAVPGRPRRAAQQLRAARHPLQERPHRPGRAGRRAGQALPARGRGGARAARQAVRLRGGLPGRAGGADGGAPGPHVPGDGDAAHHAAAVHLHGPHAPAGAAPHAAPQGHPGPRRAHGPTGPGAALPLLVQRGFAHHPLPPLSLQAHLQRVLRPGGQALLPEQGGSQCLKDAPGSGRLHMPPGTDGPAAVAGDPRKTHPFVPCRGTPMTQTHVWRPRSLSRAARRGPRTA